MNRNETGALLVVLCFAWVVGLIASCGDRYEGSSTYCTEEGATTDTSGEAHAFMPTQHVETGADVRLCDDPPPVRE